MNPYHTLKAHHASLYDVTQQMPVCYDILLSATCNPKIRAGNENAFVLYIILSLIIISL